MSDSIVKMEGVSKKFCRDLRSNMLYGLREAFLLSLGYYEQEAKLKKNEFWALHDLSFELQRGQSLGVMGNNGAGKTTLLKLVSGIVLPDRGRIEVKGRVASLLSIGAGFHPLMTGRENIFVHGAVLGLSHHLIKSHFDSIVDFAEMEAYLDAPVYTYSSGQRLRLGFSIATASRPDLLLLDEVIAVGDANFQKKCRDKIAGLRESTAIIFTSHSKQEVTEMCNLGLLLDKSSLLSFGPLDDVLQKYEALESLGEKA